jgi:hypothetical protein
LTYWTGQYASLRLSEDGKHSLKGIFGDGAEIGVFVEWADELGLWVAIDQNAAKRVAVVLIDGITSIRQC